MSVDQIIPRVVLGTAIAGLLYAVFLVRQVLREPQGNEKMIKIAKAIRLGANTYLKRQFKTIALLVVFLAAALYFTAPDQTIAIGRALAFLAGAIFSATVGLVGMNMAVQGNVRVAEAAKTGLGKALKIGYRSGTVTGMLTDGLGLLGGTTIFLLYGEKAYEVLLGFGFGGTLLALFMRVGGGIFTKAADVGADLVGKVEKGIPEDDPRNAAVIADQVGDNVGDCAGMAADIFESYEVTIVSAMILGYAAFGLPGVLFPLAIRAVGVFASIVGTYAVRIDGKIKNAMAAINRGYWISSFICLIGFFLLAQFYFKDLRVFFASITGIVLAITINHLTEYFTSLKYRPVKEIAKSTQTGPATTILTGLAEGYESSVWAILVIAATIVVATIIFPGNALLAAYAVALTGIGMLTLTGNTVSMDAFGPIADNAQGIAEMAGLPKNARRVVAQLDAVGNTTKAITKGIAIGSAVIAAVSLFGAFIEVTGLAHIDIVNPIVFVGVLIGGAVPFLFSSFAIRAVSKTAFAVVQEVRRQFAKIKGLWEGKAEADYARVVDICTKAAIRELRGPAILAITTPLLVGFLLKEEALGGFLAGLILVGQLLAVFMSNTGGAWDNAKKMIEDGKYGGKGSEAHKAGVIGDTVGDPLKDTAGPALNPLIKVINLVALLLAPMVVANQTLTPALWGAVIISIVLLGSSILSSRKV
jgi:K(+)-stimulated pyrophosphate-energized sodium pump